MYWIGLDGIWLMRKCFPRYFIMCHCNETFWSLCLGRRYILIKILCNVYNFFLALQGINRKVKKQNPGNLLMKLRKIKKGAPKKIKYEVISEVLGRKWNSEIFILV